MWSDQNISDTIYANAGRRKPCSVWRLKRYPPVFVVGLPEHRDPPVGPHRPEDSHTRYHEWRGGSVCVHCGHTVAEILDRPITLVRALEGR